MSWPGNSPSIAYSTGMVSIHPWMFCGKLSYFAEMQHNGTDGYTIPGHWTLPFCSFLYPLWQIKSLFFSVRDQPQERKISFPCKWIVFPRPGLFSVHCTHGVSYQGLSFLKPFHWGPLKSSFGLRAMGTGSLHRVLIWFFCSEYSCKENRLMHWKTHLILQQEEFTSPQPLKENR